MLAFLTGRSVTQGQFLLCQSVPLQPYYSLNHTCGIFQPPLALDSVGLGSICIKILKPEAHNRRLS